MFPTILANLRRNVLYQGKCITPPVYGKNRIILFYGTSIPACIIVFKKNRNRDDVLFIDASGKDENGNLRYRKDKNQNRLETKHIENRVFLRIEFSKYQIINEGMRGKKDN